MGEDEILAMLMPKYDELIREIIEKQNKEIEEDKKEEEKKVGVPSKNYQELQEERKIQNKKLDKMAAKDIQQVVS